MIQDYSVSQTSLEQIFNFFAAQQEEETGFASGIISQKTQEPGAGSAPVVLAPAKETELVELIPKAEP